MVDKKDPNALIPAVSMVTVKGLVTDSFTKEADLDIVMVVDLSGSMSGIPIETMKNFMLKLIDRLKEHHRLGEFVYLRGYWYVGREEGVSGMLDGYREKLG